MVMKVSVVVPVYNVEKFINSCIDSLLSQTHQHFEIIVVDDCSSDSSISLVEAYESDKIKIYSHDSNKGLSASRNTGLKYCTGDYLLFLDADDYLTPNALEKCVSVAEEYGSDVISFNSRHIDEQGKTWPVTWMEKYNNADLYNIGINNYPKLVWDVAAWNKLIRLDLYRELQLSFDEEQKWFEDHLFSLQLYSKTDKVTILHDVLHYYLRRSGTDNQSITQKKSFQVCHYRLRMMESVVIFLENSGNYQLIPYFYELVFDFYKPVLREALEYAEIGEDFSEISERFKSMIEKNSSTRLKSYSLDSVDLALCMLHLSEDDVIDYLGGYSGRVTSLRKLFSIDFPEKTHFSDEYNNLKKLFGAGSGRNSWLAWSYFILTQPFFLIFYMVNDSRDFTCFFLRKNLAIHTIEKSRVFDAGYYSIQSDKHFATLRSAVVHYVYKGEKLGLKPNRFFSARLYLNANADLKSWQSNVYSHYLRHGFRKGRAVK